jgi:hypothetical protein
MPGTAKGGKPKKEHFMTGLGWVGGGEERETRDRQRQKERRIKLMLLFQFSVLASAVPVKFHCWTIR